jgi:mannose-1-phosphate guanylyltransferase
MTAGRATAAGGGSGDAPWAIVLAAGRGQRLARLTRALYGRDVPKQFAALDGEQTFLQQTMARAGRLSPPERTVVVVAEEHAALARGQLSAFPSTIVVEQPRDVGTLSGLLLPLAHVLDADPRARVIVYPADHHVQRLSPFVEAVSGALAAVDQAPARTVLVGARPDRAATDLGWIMRGQTLGEGPGLSAVEHFVEKPGSSVAARLFEGGALWNTLLIAMDGAAFWDKALATRPELAHSFQRYRSSVATSNEASVRHEIYERLPTLDLSRDLLSNERGLAVVEMGDAGWSDCGTPERLFECLEGSGDLGGLLRRLGATGLELSP